MPNEDNAIPITSNTTYVAMSVTSPIYPNGSSAIYIGTGSNLKIHYPAAKMKNDTTYFWFVAIDRHTLGIAHEVVQESNTTVPAGFQDGGQYDSDEYILVFSTMYMSTLKVPQGELYDFLIKSGACNQLRRLEQVFLQLNCGSYGRMAYSLIDVLGSPGQGFEESSFLNQKESTVATLSLMGQDINGRMMYTPVSLH